MNQSLDNMLSQITKDNIYPEILVVLLVGKEFILPCKHHKGLTLAQHTRLL